MDFIFTVSLQQHCPASHAFTVTSPASSCQPCIPSFFCRLDAKFSFLLSLFQQLEGQFAREWGLTDSEDSYHSEEGEAQEETEGVAENQETGEEELLLDELYCVACNKAFKTEKA